MRRLALSAAMLLGLGACGVVVEAPPASTPTAATEPAPCEASIDAIGFTCEGGRSFSVRHDMTDACVVVFEGDNTYVLPRNAEGDAFTNGTVTFTQEVATATLTGVEPPYLGCAVVEGHE